MKRKRQISPLINTDERIKKAKSQEPKAKSQKPKAKSQKPLPSDQMHGSIPDPRI
jgi:hypothetical protein